MQKGPLKITSGLVTGEDGKLLHDILGRQSSPAVLDAQKYFHVPSGAVIWWCFETSNNHKHLRFICSGWFSALRSVSWVSDECGTRASRLVHSLRNVLTLSWLVRSRFTIAFISMPSDFWVGKIPRLFNRPKIYERLFEAARECNIQSINHPFWVVKNAENDFSIVKSVSPISTKHFSLLPANLLPSLASHNWRIKIELIARAVR